MFTVIVTTHCGYTFEKTYIDPEYASMVAATAITAEDFKHLDIIDATTGEVIVECDYTDRVPHEPYF